MPSIPARPLRARRSPAKSEARRDARRAIRDDRGVSPGGTGPCRRDRRARRRPRPVRPPARPHHGGALRPPGELLAHCDAVICHGGAGTTLSALAHGVPLVIVPVASDHHEVAELTRAAGCALTVPLGSLTPAAAVGALEAVLGDPRYRESAGAVASEMAAMPGPAEVAARLIDWTSSVTSCHVGRGPRKGRG